ncbi:MbtH family NRPS accessory protein [Streptomyces sp. NPDC048442]|uniref:MbtH family NRPS accessory protein n=1 Tax=Streptomyces sp. NPDC048442 TaxID=3154823 RepID=UPI00344AF209
MTTSPFDAPEAETANEPTHLLLRNGRGAHSLWPVFRQVPDGWETVHGPAPYGQCVAHLQEPPE